MSHIYKDRLKPVFDFFFSIAVLCAIMPLWALICMAITVDSRGGIIYRQKRVGLNGKVFYILKFRTMYVGADKMGLLTIGGKDPRVTRVGYYLRKYKLDELPQFLNVLKGNMSIIGPRPEVPQYVAMYNNEQKKVLDVKPGITDYASIEFADESNLLAQFSHPEDAYINSIMPAKLKLNLLYINNIRFTTDASILFRTLKKIVS